MASSQYMIDDKDFNTISERIEVAVKERFNATNRQIESIQKSVDTLSGDLDVDRKSLSQMAIDLATLTQQVKELLKNVQGIPKKITDKVNDQAQEVMEQTASAVAEQVEPVMNKAVKKLNRGLPLLKFHWWEFRKGRKI